MLRANRFCRPNCAIFALSALALALMWPEPAHALIRWMGVQPDTRERLWLSAFSGFTLGLAIGLFAYEMRARGVSVALRRLTTLAASIDGRVPAETQRGSVKQELERLSEEVMFSARRMTRERKELDEQATAWQAMFAATLDSMFVLDDKGVVRQINPAAERQFKLDANEAVGRHLADLLFPLSHRVLDHAAFMQDVAAGKAVGRRQEMIVHCGQRQFPVEMAIAEFHVGDARGLIATARDISAHRQARADLKRVREQADRLQARLRSELASHRVVRPASEAAGHAADAQPFGADRWHTVHGRGGVRRRHPPAGRKGRAQGAGFPLRRHRSAGHGAHRRCIAPARGGIRPDRRCDTQRHRRRGHRPYFGAVHRRAHD